MSKNRGSKKQRGNQPKQPVTIMPDFSSHYQEVCDDIDQHIRAAATLVSQMNPLDLLLRGYKENAALSFGKASEADFSHDEAISRRMIDYLQCLIVSTPPHPDGYIATTEELWLELKEHIYSIFSNLVAYFITSSAKRRNEPDFDEDWEELYTKAVMNWCFVRGNRHIVQIGNYLKSILDPHDDIIQELFGITVDSLIRDIEKIRYALTTGLAESEMEVKNIHEEFFKRLKQDVESFPKEDEDLRSFFRRKMDEYGYKSSFEQQAKRFLGTDLFNLERVTNLPTILLENLSLSPGEDNLFFAGDQFQGWPLNLWPTWNKPFLKVFDKFYCFDLYNLSDNIYRAIQRIIFQLKPEYKPIWSDRQQQISEDLPLDLLNNILPNAVCYRNVYYTRRTGQSKTRNWVECDGLLVYDDHLFIIEVKAGAFTYTPPATDAPAYIRSVKTLLFNPAEQGQRFLDYLESAEEVTLYDKDHREIGRISRKNFRQITICCITLDQLTQLAAKSSHLKAIEGGLSVKNVWNISIDDLRVYADIILNPLQFLHFIEQRHAASNTSLIILDDELDHLGMYLKKNRYAQFADELVSSKSISPDFIVWSGFTKEIDKYYAYLLAGESIDRPIQDIPSTILEILKVLTNESKVGRARVASKLLDMSGETRHNFESNVRRSIMLTKQRMRPQPVSLFGKVQITVYCIPIEQRFGEDFDITEYVLSTMAVRNEKERLLLELFFNQEDIIISVNFRFINDRDMSNYDESNIKEKSEDFANRRVALAKLQGKIKFNGQCPCGSGKKYKYCHGPIKRSDDQT